MRYRIAVLTLGFAALAAGCTTASGTPATAPSVPETAPTTTLTLPSTTATAPAIATTTSTTLDRLSEIQAIYQDLEHRRLQAIYDQDEDAFRGLYANDEYEELSIEVFETIHVVDPSALVEEEFLLVSEGPDCLAAEIARDYTEVLETGGKSSRVYVLERSEDVWGISWVGEGWTCDGPHPFSQ